MNLHVAGKFLADKNIIKVKRDFYDSYLWVLTADNEVYRINSLIPSDVTDYTLIFSAFSNFKFIDIAGVNKDIVFIATNSNNVISYKNGNFKIIGAAEGIDGKVNGLAINAAYPNFPFNGTDYMLISTETGLRRYNYVQETMEPVNNEKPIHLYEASYRTLNYGGGDFCRCYYEDPIVKPTGLVSMLGYTVYGSDIYTGGLYGNVLNTAFITAGNPYDVSREFTVFAHNFWGTEKGLFQNYWQYSYDPERGHKQYLNNINVTKITSLMGLKKFSNESELQSNIIRENLIVGTSNGLYFSNSQYHKGWQGPDYKFFHFDDLGNIPINDINVNADTYNFPKDRLIYSHGAVCEDGIWVATSIGLFYLIPDYKPYINPDTKIQAIRVDGHPFFENELEVCENVAIKASIEYVQYNSLKFIWYKNGQLINGETSNVLNINSAGDYHAKLIDPCSDISFETQHLKVKVITAPIITFNYPNVINQCEGTIAKLQVNNNTNYQYRWRKNNILTGDKDSNLNISQPGKYKVEVSSCSGNWVATKEVEVNFIKVAQPTLSANKNAYCVGDVAQLSTTFINNGSYTINWFRDGNILTSEQNKTSLTTTLSGSYTVKVNSNLVNCDNTSAAYTLSFESKPSLSLERIITATFCDGQTMDIKATYTGGTIKWNTGASSDKITVNRSGTYTAMIKTAAGCEVTENIDVQFFANPILNLPDATLCQFIGENITLTAPSGFAKYEWNGKAGSASFSTNKLGTVNLRVTNNNGCTAVQTINVTSRCSEIHVPNAFTPNNDGYNDSWKIEGLEGDPNIMVRVYNRQGEMIFKSIGYQNPWNGTYNGKKLPVGIYYYVINAKNSAQTLSGSVTIVN